MRAHDQISLHAPGRRSPVIVVIGMLASLLAFGLAKVSAQGPAAPTSRTSFSSGDPGRIDVSASSVEVWKEGATQWLHLRGQAAVVQGTRELRADEAIVRVQPRAYRFGNTE